MDYRNAIDPKLIADQGAGTEHAALVYAPRKGGRRRFPENCVTEQADAAVALAAADPAKHLHPAVVLGPFRSSEGFRLYYLVRWLD